MKKKLLLFFVMAMAMTAEAQHEEGDLTIQPRVGLTFSTITNQDDIKTKINITYGFETEYYFIDKMSVAGGLLFTNQGYKFDYYDISNSKYTAKFDNYYAAIPITFNYYIIDGFAVKLGVQPAFRVKTKLKMDNEKLDLDDAMDVLFPMEDVSLNKFDFSIPIGFSYEYNHMTVDARYNFGLTKLFKGVDDSSRNSVFVLTLGYKL